jgi:hypothetical protein
LAAILNVILDFLFDTIPISAASFVLEQQRCRNILVYEMLIICVDSRFIKISFIRNCYRNNILSISIDKSCKKKIISNLEGMNTLITAFRKIKPPTYPITDTL